jgi:hypothetical protein
VSTLENVALFQAGWLACVLGAVHGMPAIALPVAAAIVARHVWTSRAPRRELALVGLVCAIGAIFDSALAASGLIVYREGVLIAGAAPYWIVALWALFATTLNRSLAWLHGRYALAAILGAVAGPLSYWAGARLGALELGSPATALAALALGWAVILPGLMRLARAGDSPLAADRAAAPSSLARLP